MGAPWKKQGGWPYERRRGKSWQLGYRDHEGRVRAKAFKTKTAAETWAKEYVHAERRNRLREFLLGSDAPEVRPDATPLALADLVLDWRESAERAFVDVLNVVLDEAERHAIDVVIAAVTTWALQRLHFRGRGSARPVVVIWVGHEDVREVPLPDLGFAR